MKKSVLSFLALGFALLLAGSAQAVQLTGTFQVTGTLAPICGSSSCGLAAATAIDFTSGNSVPTPGVPGSVTVTQATGSFTTLIPVSSTGLIKDFAFNQASTANYPNPNTNPISSFIDISSGQVTFDLATVGISSQGVGFLNLAGTGTLHGAGFDDTFGNWTFASNITPGQDAFVFTALNSAVPSGVPEPSLLLLIGVGLVGLAAWGKVKAKNSK